MNPWFAKAIILLGTIMIVTVPAFLQRRGAEIKVVKSQRGLVEIILLTLVWLGSVPSLIWVATPVLAFADYPLRPLPFIAGIVCLAPGLWLFYRAHADLGTNWSITLEVREKHQLVTQGIYRNLRHPMYLGLLPYSTGQGLVVPNWVAGPSYLVALVLLFVLRVVPEECMMREEFGKDYEAYMARTKRLVPGLW